MFVSKSELLAVRACAALYRWLEDCYIQAVMEFAIAIDMSNGVPGASMYVEAMNFKAPLEQERIPGTDSRGYHVLPLS